MRATCSCQICGTKEVFTGDAQLRRWIDTHLCHQPNFEVVVRKRHREETWADVFRKIIKKNRGDKDG